MRKRNRAVSKLRSVEGVTLSVALLYFLICACVGSVVLAAAGTSAGRSSSADTETNRQRYAVTSAAQMLQDSFSDVSSGSTLTMELKGLNDPDVGNMKNQSFMDNGNLYVYSNYMNVDSKQPFFNGTTVQSLRLFRDLLALSVYRHFISNITNHKYWQDTWTDQTQTLDWAEDVAVDDYSISTKEDSPFEIELSTSETNGFSYEKVYAEFSIDENLEITADLYCKNEKDNTKGFEEWITFNPDSVIVKISGNKWRMEAQFKASWSDGVVTTYNPKEG